MPPDPHTLTPIAPGGALRLAVFGWVQDGAGSVSSAHYKLCEGLLAAGHELDLYATAGFVPDPRYNSDRFAYVPIDASLRRELRPGLFPSSVRPLVLTLAGRRSTNRYLDSGLIVARSRHAVRPYDAMLFLGLAPRDTLHNVPTLVWGQSAPQNELHAVRGLAGPVRRVSGRAAYLKLRLYYEAKDHLVWGWAREHHLVLASAQARVAALRFGVPAARVCVSPYAIDLDRFAPGPMPTGAKRRVLCIGRLDPRKRVDLLVDAVDLLSQRRDDFHVEVIGRDGYLPGWSAFVERAAARLPLTYTPAVPQAEIRARLLEADVVVQPSEREEFGHAIAEALACGVPVVTGPTNGTTEWAPASGSARFDCYSPDSLADALDRALNLSRDPAAREACRSAAQAFDRHSVAARIVAHIRTM
jgi:glycosyltransferase involved in cell wall biosynthesis